MIITIIIYVALTALSTVFAYFAGKKDNRRFFYAFLITALIAGLFLAMKLYDPESDTKVYMSVGGAAGGMNFNSFMMWILCMLPPYILGTIAAIKAGDKKKKRKW